jgi:hypothetical protein
VAKVAVLGQPVGVAGSPLIDRLRGDDYDE